VQAGAAGAAAGCGVTALWAGVGCRGMTVHSGARRVGIVGCRGPAVYATPTDDDKWVLLSRATCRVVTAQFG
jgi:hypothetical protein